MDRERSEKEALNKDVREYCARVAYLEELLFCLFYLCYILFFLNDHIYLEEHLKGKEMEREELLEVYQRLGDENVKLVESFKQSQTQVESLRYLFHN